MDVLYSLTSSLKKNQKCAPIWNWFYVNFLADFAMCSVSRFINLRERIHDAVGVTRIAFKD